MSAPEQRDPLSGMKDELAKAKAPDLLDAVFYDGAPIWRRPCAAHVKAWERHIRRTSFRLFHTDPAFRAAYHERGGMMGQTMEMER